MGSRKLPCSFGSCAETEFSKKIPAKRMKAYNFIIMFFCFYFAASVFGHFYNCKKKTITFIYPFPAMHMCIASVIHLNMALFLVNIYSRQNTILSLTQTKHCKCISAIRAWLKPSHTHQSPRVFAWVDQVCPTHPKQNGDCTDWQFLSLSSPPQTGKRFP